MAVIENDVLMKFKDSSGNVNLLYPITRAEDVDGLQEAIRDQGVVTEGTGAVYTATVEGITSLSAGVSFVMVPHTVSTSSSAKLNVNNLGEKFIRRRVSGSTTTTYSTKTSDDWLAAGKPIRVMYDGTQWIADLPVPNANDIMGAVPIANGGTGSTTAAQARINLGIETTDGTVSSGNADYAEVGEWIDGNPDAEDRIGYFVCIDNNTPGTKMRKATSSDDIRGVTVASPAFADGCSANKYTQSESSDPDADSRAALLPKYAYVAVMGIVPVIDDGTCAINGRCMPNDSGIATSVSGDYGYQVIDRIDETHVLVAVEPGTDFQYKVKNYINSGISKAAPVNLLDNSDFRNPVMQAGFNSLHGSVRYPIDKWYDRYGFGAFTKTDNGITVAYGTNHGYFCQKVENYERLSGKYLTLALCDYDGNVYCASSLWNTSGSAIRIQLNADCEASFLSEGFVQIVVTSGSIGLRWAALYEGSYTAETLPEYHQKGYANELLVCRQYDLTTGDYIGLRKFGQPHNLLDNSDFRNPVNQKGFVSGTSGQNDYTIDRWILQYDTSLYLESDCIAVSRYWDFKQLMGCRFYAGKTYTFVVDAKSEVATGKAYIRLGLVNGDGREGRPDINNAGWTKCVYTWTADKDYEPGEIQFSIGVNTGSELTTKIYYKNPAVYEGSYTIDTLPEYQPKGYMVEALNCGALHVTTTATITTAWSGSGPYTQAVSVSGILATDMPHIMPVYSTTNSTAISQKEAWACVSKAETSANTITFTCFEEKPSTDIPIQIEVMR